MTTRRIILIALGLFLVFGVVSFVVRSVQTRTELSGIAGSDPTRQDTGVKNLMARDALFDALQGGSPPNTRLHAIQALQRLAAAGDQKAFQQLLQMLKDPDTESAEKKTHPVRDAAKDAVAAVGTRYPDLLLDAAKNADSAIRDQSREALKKIGAPLQEQMASRLGDKDLRAPLGGILAGIGPQTVPLVTPYLQPPLLKTDASADDLAKAKVELIETLGKYAVPVPAKDGTGPTPAEIGVATNHVADAARAIIPFKNDENPNVRRTVITSLSNIALPVAEPTLIEALSDPRTDSDARQAAAGALGAIATPAANAAMVRALSDLDLRVATAATAGLKRAGDKAASAIAGALASPDPAVRARAAEAAGGMSTTTLAARALTDPDAKVRAAAAGALGDIGGSAAVGPLLTALADSDGTVAQTASQALGTIGDAAIGPIITRLGSDDKVAYYASQALETIGKAAVDPLLTAAAPGKPGARWAAITLGEIGDPRAASALQALKASPDPDTAWAANVALTKVQQS